MIDFLFRSVYPQYIPISLGLDIYYIYIYIYIYMLLSLTGLHLTWPEPPELFLVRLKPQVLVCSLGLKQVSNKLRCDRTPVSLYAAMFEPMLEGQLAAGSPTSRGVLCSHCKSQMSLLQSQGDIDKRGHGGGLLSSLKFSIVVWTSGVQGTLAPHAP